MVVGPEVLMELFECGFKGNLGVLLKDRDTIGVREGLVWEISVCVCVCVLKNAEQAAQLLKRRMKGT